MGACRQCRNAPTDVRRAPPGRGDRAAASSAADPSPDREHGRAGELTAAQVAERLVGLCERRAARDAEIATRRQDAREALERQLAAIPSETDARVAELRRQQTEFLTTLAERGERRFEEAVSLYLRVVGEVAS